MKSMGIKIDSLSLEELQKERKETDTLIANLIRQLNELKKAAKLEPSILNAQQAGLKELNTELENARSDLDSILWRMNTMKMAIHRGLVSKL